MSQCASLFHSIKVMLPGYFCLMIPDSLSYQMFLCSLPCHFNVRNFNDLIETDFKSVLNSLSPSLCKLPPTFLLSNTPFLSALCVSYFFIWISVCLYLSNICVFLTDCRPLFLSFNLYLFRRECFTYSSLLYLNG